MVDKAHGMGLSVHAWLNPYRISSSTTNINTLPKSSYAYKWAKSSSKAKRRNVLKYNGGLYYNPAKPDVRNLINNGVKEIVKNYNVDGIHLMITSTQILELHTRKTLTDLNIIIMSKPEKRVAKILRHRKLEKTKC